MKKDINFVTFNELKNIDTICAVCGLSFPESANEFQCAALLLAHLMASVRNLVLNGVDLNEELIELCSSLTAIMKANYGAQR